MEYLNNRSIELQWIGGIPGNEKRTALLIPQFNESANFSFAERLEYFKGLADEYGDQLDVILIDDGSTDDSLSKMRQFHRGRSGSFYVASVFPNANKVGALYLTTTAISHEFIILSDFDTDILGLEKMLTGISLLENDHLLMGCYFRMLPYEGTGMVFAFQQIEYSIARCLYKFHKKERSTRVMPGAGSCYKREVLLSIYKLHSGLRSGEDREATLLGLKLGYKAFYMKNVLALTRPPLSFSALARQRIRWNLGYFETFEKERKYYFAEMSRLSRIGIVSLMDMSAALAILILPVIGIVIGLISIRLFLIFIALLYAGHLSWCFRLFIKMPEEFAEIGKNKYLLLLYYPFMKIYTGYLAWTSAFIIFLKKIPDRRKRAQTSIQEKSEPYMNIPKMKEPSVSE